MMLGGLWMLALVCIPVVEAGPPPPADLPLFVEIHTKIIEDYAHVWAILQTSAGAFIAVCGLSLLKLSRWSRTALLIVACLGVPLLGLYGVCWGVAVVDMHLKGAVPVYHTMGALAALSLFVAVTVVALVLAIKHLRSDAVKRMMLGT